jgi:glycine cleavage system transcriptional repressor
VPEFAVTAIGRDRPGIVAAVSRALLELEGNIEDSQMSILRGHFAVMLIVAVPDASAEEVARSLGAVRDELGLEAITVEPVDQVEAEAPRPTHVLTVYGADHPGIVSAVAGVLAAEGVNITDLNTRLAGTEDRPLYAMMLEVALGDADPARLEERLSEVGAREDVEVSLREHEAEAL